MNTEETLLNIDFGNKLDAVTQVDDSVLSLSSSTEEIHLVPEVVFEGTVDSNTDNRESQPLLGARDLDVSYNQFPGHYNNIYQHMLSLLWS